jgi:hypothetical protein
LPIWIVAGNSMSSLFDWIVIASVFIVSFSFSSFGRQMD